MSSNSPEDPVNTSSSIDTSKETVVTDNIPSTSTEPGTVLSNNTLENSNTDVEPVNSSGSASGTSSVAITPETPAAPPVSVPETPAAPPVSVPETPAAPFIQKEENRPNSPPHEDPSTDWFKQMQYVIFNSELTNLKKGNMNILKECADSKRLLDLKFLDLTNQINRVQTSVIALSTISGFLNATKGQFNLSENLISVISISISTYVTLVLSISKYYKFDESRESIQALREKYAILHNKIEHRADVLGPWCDKNLWKFNDPKKKLEEWSKIKIDMDEEYELLIETKKTLTTEFEIIMDTRSRNVYNIVNKKLTYYNRKELADWAISELELEASIEDRFAVHDAKRAAKNTPSMSAKRRQSIQSGHEALEDNWDNDDLDF